MKDLEYIDFTDFFWNGHYLSDLGGVVADNDGGELNYPLLPARNYTTSKPFNYDGEIVFSTYLSPRTLEVPVFFEDLNYHGIRRIATWLNTEKAAEFYFKGDSIRINCRLDSDALAFETYSGIEGLSVLKFIAHDPFYYDIEKTVYSINAVIADKYYSYYNRGMIQSDCVISVNGSGNITVKLKGKSDGAIQTFTVKNVANSFKVDSKAMICLDAAGRNKFNDFVGAFPSVPPGYFDISFTGNVTSASIQFHGKYV